MGQAMAGGVGEGKGAAMPQAELRILVLNKGVMKPSAMLGRFPRVIVLTVRPN